MQLRFTSTYWSTLGPSEERWRESSCGPCLLRIMYVAHTLHRLVFGSCFEYGIVPPSNALSSPRSRSRYSSQSNIWTQSTPTPAFHSFLYQDFGQDIDITGSLTNPSKWKCVFRHLHSSPPHADAHYRYVVSLIRSSYASSLRPRCCSSMRQGQVNHPPLPEPRVEFPLCPNGGLARRR